MLLYYLFWMFMGFIKHFYIVFGTNLLTQSPVPVSVFSLFLSIAERKTKRSPIDLKFDRDYFWTRRSPRSTEDGPGESRGHHEGGGAPYPPGRAPYLVASSVVSWCRVQVSWIIFFLKITFPKVSFRLDSVWYSFSTKHWNKGKT